MTLSILEGKASWWNLSWYSQSGFRRGIETRQRWVSEPFSSVNESSGCLINCHPWCRGFVVEIWSSILNSARAAFKLVWWTMAFTFTATYLSFNQSQLGKIKANINHDIHQLRDILVKVSSKPNSWARTMTEFCSELISAVEYFAQTCGIEARGIIIWSQFLFDKLAIMETRRNRSWRSSWSML